MKPLRSPLDHLLAFKHVEKPKGLPLAELVALFDLLGLAEGLIRNTDTHEEAVKQLRSRANELTEKVVTVAQQVQTGLPCWGSELIPTEDREQQRQKLDDLKGFLEGLQAFNTPGKLKNFTKSVSEVQAQAAHARSRQANRRVERAGAGVDASDWLLGDCCCCATTARPVAHADGDGAQRVAGETDGPHRSQRRRLPPEDQPGTPEDEVTTTGPPTSTCTRKPGSGSTRIPRKKNSSKIPALNASRSWRRAYRSCRIPA